MYKKFLSIIFLVVLAFLEGCSGCSQSGIRSSGRRGSISNLNHFASSTRGRTIVKMEKLSDVYQIPVLVNNVEMYFIFDTGAGLISISATEAIFLYKQGKLKNEDIIGKANFQDANGDISEGTIIKLRSIKIGDRTIHDIEASVVPNMTAPLLFGQSALEKFGKISIDYSRNEISFE